MKMFKPFLKRCSRSFQRNFVASLIPLVFPLIFLFLFMDVAADAGKPVAMRIGLSFEQVPDKLVEGLIATELADVQALKAPYDGGRIDSKHYDAIGVWSEDSNTLSFHIRSGYAAWLDAVLAVAEQHEFAKVKIEKHTVTDETYTSNGFLAYILPGLFVMILIQIATTSTANLVLSDRTDGTLRIISSVHNAIMPMFLAELLFRLLFTAVCYFTMMLIANTVAGFSLGDKFWLFSMVYLLGAAMMIALGYLLGGTLPSQRNWSGLITLLGMSFWFFTDILFQASQHPIARPLALILPPTYLTDALRQISTGQPGTFSLLFDVVMLFAWLILFSALAIKFFKFETTDNRM
jgi:ABC-type multidrug transport system permease subunit